MIDTWEILGRMLTDEEFRARVYRTAPSSRPRVNKATRAEFAERNFTRLRTVVTEVIRDRPISLAGLGEILWPLSNNTKPFRRAILKLARIIQASGADTGSSNPYFFVALGAMMVDPNLRAVLLSETPFTPFDNFGFTSLSLADRAALVAIFTFTPPGITAVQAPGDSASNDVCDTQWGSDCFLRTIWWEYPPEYQRGTKKVIHHPHSHPVPLPVPAGTARKK
jgi:hypothetical protein